MLINQILVKFKFKLKWISVFLVLFFLYFKVIQIQLLQFTLREIQNFKFITRLVMQSCNAIRSYSLKLRLLHLQQGLHLKFLAFIILLQNYFTISKPLTFKF
ncbi:unnamed protein product [Paramecium sonneborni]|uniref:Transmembrane protein n=1 Tax=Paramecium sonneborni TaxID=65129 RepID=A0A8S1M9D6_9CILI|nr:unnamed protein product [Paramecium sonneborni]